MITHEIIRPWCPHCQNLMEATGESKELVNADVRYIHTQYHCKHCGATPWMCLADFEEMAKRRASIQDAMNRCYATVSAVIAETAVQHCMEAFEVNTYIWGSSKSLAQQALAAKVRVHFEEFLRDREGFLKKYESLVTSEKDTTMTNRIEMCTLCNLQMQPTGVLQKTNPPKHEFKCSQCNQSRWVVDEGLQNRLRSGAAVKKDVTGES